MVGLGMANLMSIHQLQNGQQPPGHIGAAALMLKNGAYLKAGDGRALGSEQQTRGNLPAVPHGQVARSRVVHGEWPSCSFPFDQAQEEQATTIHRLLHSAINNVDPNATGIVLDGTFYPFSAKCTPFQPGRGFLLPPEVEVRWDDSLPFPQKPVEQRVLVYYPAEKRVRWEAYTDDRKQVEGTALLVESRTFTLQLEKELCIKYEMRLSQDVLNFMQAESSPMLISHSVRPFRLRASTSQSPEIALSVSSAGALHPDSTWQVRSGTLADGRLSRLSGTPPLEPSNAKAISNLFLFHRKLHWPERVPPEAPLQQAAMRDGKAALLNGAPGAGPSLSTRPALTTAIPGRERTIPLQVSQTLARLQNGRTAVPQPQVILQPGLNGARRHGVAEANGVRAGIEGLGRLPSSHSQRTDLEAGLRGAKGLNNFSFSTSADLTSWAPALSKAAETVSQGGQEKPRGVGAALDGGLSNRVPMLGYTMDKISRLTAQQQTLLQQQHMLQQRQMGQMAQPQQPPPRKPLSLPSCLPIPSSTLSNMIPTPGYVPPQSEQLLAPPPPPPVTEPEPPKKAVKGRSRAKKPKQDAASGLRPLSPASSAANSSAGSPPLTSPTASRNPSPVTLPSTYDQNIPIAQLFKAGRKKHKNELAYGGSSPTASRDSHKQSQRPLQRTASSISGGSFLSGLSNPGANTGPEVASPGATMIPTPGLSFLGPNRPSSSQGRGGLPFLPTDCTSTGSLLDSPRFSNVLTGRGQNGFFAPAARSSDSLQGMGGGSLGGRGVSLGTDPSFGGMQMIPTPGLLPTPGLHNRVRSWEPNADLLSDLQSSGTNGAPHAGVAALDRWPQQQSSFMDMLTDDAVGGEQAEEDGGGGEAADASADPFKEVLDSLDLSLFQEEGGLTPSEQEGGPPVQLHQSVALVKGPLSRRDSRAGMDVQVQDMGNNCSWQGVVPQSVIFGGAQMSGTGGYSNGSTGLDFRMNGVTLGGGEIHSQLPMTQKVQPHANPSLGGWNHGTGQEGYGLGRSSGFAVGESGAVLGQAQGDPMGLDAGSDPGLNGALDELMELDADFLDINIDDGTLFEGGIGPGDWSDLGGF